jgi:hypothetical protein
VLDDAKRREIVAILSVGCSQRTAAKYVGCTVQTIHRTALRDAKFAEKLRQAKCGAEIGLLKNIRNAAKKEQYWRAAAWALERGFPEKYCRRGPDVITVEQISHLLGQFTDIIVAEIPVPRYRKRIIKRLEDLTHSLGGAAQRAGEKGTETSRATPSPSPSAAPPAAALPAEENPQ